MAGVLQRFEQRLEGAVTGAFARAFRSAVQPVEIAAALQREVDNTAHILSRDRRLVPNDFTVELSDSDHERLVPFGDTLVAELSTMVQDHVTEQRYTLAGPLAITFVNTPELGTGRFRVRSKTNAAVTGSEGATNVTTRPSDVTLEVNGGTLAVPSTGSVIGRGSEADIKIDDPGISRRHAEVSVHRNGGDVTVSVVDLGSTNGVVLNGHRVTSAVVADGSEIRLGNTVLVVRIAGDR
ncbi:FhaA domain-containing protein [Aeromicrobium sp. CF3.5]|uniref:FhaA domain-containing protein n=1 Tax=Aeromicrobium sp. CF3.5 TaxID=3373078 RepID=UPI003EE4A2D6